MFEREESLETKAREEIDQKIKEQDTLNELDTKGEREEVKKDSDALSGPADRFKREHDELLQAKPRSLDIPIPAEIDVYIHRGLAQGIKVQKAGRFRKWSILAACFLLVIFLTSVRVSPAVAAAIQRIPGLGYIVELINYDKGLQSAVENDFIQPLGLSDEHENVVFTVDGIIMDESSLVIF